MSSYPLGGNGGIMSDIVSSNREGIRRLKTEDGATCYDCGRMQRFFYEFNIPTSESRWIRVTVPNGSVKGIIIRDQRLNVDGGSVRFRAYRDLTIEANFAAIQSPSSGLFAANNIVGAPVYDLQTEIDISNDTGTFSGGIVAEVLRVRSAGATAQQVTVSGSGAGRRGIAPAVYHLQLENIGNSSALGVYDLEFEEVPV